MISNSHRDHARLTAYRYTAGVNAPWNRTDAAGPEKRMTMNPPKTPLTKEHLKDHLTYSGWKYLVMAAFVAFTWSMVYTQTEYRPPEDKRVDLYIKSSTTNTDIVDAFLLPIWQEAVPDMESVRSVMLMAGNDTGSVMQLSVYIAAGEGDIYILPKEDFKNYASAGAFIPLDSYVADGVIDTEGLDLSAGYVQRQLDYDDNGFVTYEETPILLGIPMDQLYGYVNGMQLDNRGMVMGITIHSNNEENVVKFMNAFIQAGRGENPWPAGEEQRPAE